MAATGSVVRGIRQCGHGMPEMWHFPAYATQVVDTVSRAWIGRPARKKPPTKDLAQSKGISENEQLLPTSESVDPLKDRLQEQNYRGELALIKLK